MLKPNIELLCNVLKNQSTSLDNQAQLNFAHWIINTLKKIDDNFHYEFDKVGNLYITKGRAELYPCMVAHLDTVHEYVDNFIITKIGNFIIGFDGDFGVQVGCGADDRVGISIAMEMFKVHDNIKLFFPVNEEVGKLPFTL